MYNCETATSYGMNKKVLYVIVIIVVAVVVLALFLWQSARCGYRSFWPLSRCIIETPLESGDINRDLDGLDLDGLDNEFDQVDRDLNSL